MSLVFASTKHITVADDVSYANQNEFTVMLWSNRTTVNVNNQNWWRKQDGANFKYFRIEGTNSQAHFSIARSGGTLELLSATSTVAANVWEFWACNYKESTDESDIYRGTLSANAAIVSYAFENRASGTTNDDTGTGVNVGGQAGANQSMVGRMARFMWVNRYLTLNEIISCQWSCRNVPDTVISFFLGWQGVSTVADLSGTGNVGTTVNSPILGDHVPLGPPFGFDEPFVSAAAAVDISHVAALADSFDNVVQRRPIKVTSY